MKSINQFLACLSIILLPLMAYAVPKVNSVTLTPSTTDLGNSVTLKANLYDSTNKYFSGLVIFTATKPGASTETEFVSLNGQVGSPVSTSFTPTSAGSWSVKAQIVGEYWNGSYPSGAPMRVNDSFCSASTLTVNQDVTFAGSLVVEDNDPSLIMINYAVWFGPDGNNGSGGFNWQNNYFLDFLDFSPTNSPSNPKNQEIAAVNNGTAFPKWKISQLNAIPAVSSSSLSRGYNSYDENVIEQHWNLMRMMGVDIISLDLSNEMCKNFGTSSYGTANDTNRIVRKSSKAIIEKFHDLNQNHSSGYKIRVIPLFGGQRHEFPGTLTDYSNYLDNNAYKQTPSLNDKSPYQVGLMWYFNLIEDNPSVAVIYEEHPLILVYHGVTSQIEKHNFVINHQMNALASDYKSTVRSMVAYPEFMNQSWHANENNTFRERPIYTRLLDEVWCYADRYYTNGDQHDSFGTYTMNTDESRTEFVPIIPISKDGPSIYATTTPYHSWENGSMMIDRFSMARELGFPQFLHIPNWNHFMAHDSGLYLETAGELEPTTGDYWGTAIYDRYSEIIANYRAYEDGNGVGRISRASIRALASNNNNGKVGFDVGIVMDGNSSPNFFIKGIGPNTAFANALGVNNVVRNPKLELEYTVKDSITNAILTTGSRFNDNWGTFEGTSGSLANNVRSFHNSPIALKDLGGGTALLTKEAALNVSIPANGTYVLKYTNTENILTDRIGHVEFTVSDLVSDTRISTLNVEARVEEGNKLIILEFEIDKPLSFAILGKSKSNLDPLVRIYRLTSGTPVQVAANGNLSTSQVKQSLISFYGGIHGTITNTDAGMILNNLPAGKYSVHLSVQPGMSSGLGFLDVSIY